MPFPDLERSAALERTYPNLRHFFAAYLHQDWSDDYQDTMEALADLLTDRPSPALKLRAELDATLATCTDDVTLEQMVVDLGLLLRALLSSGERAGVARDVAERVHARASLVRLAVEPVGFADAAHACRSGNLVAAMLTDRLAVHLQEYGGMAGDDATSAEFAEAY